MASKEGSQRGRALIVHASLLKRIASEFKEGETWGRTLRLRLPATSPYASSTPPSASPPFVFQADDLVNVSPFTGLGLPASLAHSTSPSSAPTELDNPALIPIWARQHALLARGLSMHFWAGHRRAAYVLAVETAWADELSSLAAAQSAAPGETGDTGVEVNQPWEKEEMEQLEWEEWCPWVESEREAQCTARADVEVPLPLCSNKLAGHLGAKASGPPSSPQPQAVLLPLILCALLWRPQQALQLDEQLLWMEIALWADNADVRDFERRLYKGGKGKATWSGFRACA
ncbi:hypothetical protein JCM10207_008638 [Rhodosporidiobolus poonsookiae]